MSWVIYILIVLAVVAIGIFAYFYYKKSLDKEEKRLIKILKKVDIISV